MLFLLQAFSISIFRIFFLSNMRALKEFSLAKKLQLFRIVSIFVELKPTKVGLQFFQCNVDNSPRSCI